MQLRVKWIIQDKSSYEERNHARYFSY